MNHQQTLTLKKRCCRCHRLKPVTEFYCHKTNKDGRRFECKTCSIELTREYQRHHPDVRRTQSRRYYERHRLERIEHQTAYCQEHLEERRAYGRRYYAEHKAAYREYRAERREYFRLKMQEYRRDPENLERMRATSREWSRQFRQRAKLRELEHKLNGNGGSP